MGIKIFDDKMYQLATDIIGDLMETKLKKAGQSELLSVLMVAVEEYGSMHTIPTG